MGRVLFYRDFQGFTGGHLKVWNYFNHTLKSKDYQPYVSFTPNSLWNSTNPWSLFPQQVIIGQDSPRSAEEIFTPSQQFIKDLASFSIAQDSLRCSTRETFTSSQQIVQDLSSFSKFNSSEDILFLAGLDWLRLSEEKRRNSPVPIINLIQGFRHADPHHRCYEFLQYPAIRICVSQEIKAAIAATGIPKGKIFVIPNGIDLEKFTSPRPMDGVRLPDRSPQVTIVALKQPQLARQLKLQLQATFPEIQIKMIDSFLPRHEFIQCLQESQITIFLPLATEGFYLPALEGMAAGTLVICPDCVGNRSFCLDNWNCWRPEYKLASIFQAVEQALVADSSKQQEIHRHAQLTVAKHDLIAERQAFLEILANVEQLWREVLTE